MENMKYANEESSIGPILMKAFPKFIAVVSHKNLSTILRIIKSTFRTYSFEHLKCVSESCFFFITRNYNPAQFKIKDYHFKTLTFHSVDMNNHAQFSPKY